MKSIGGTEHPPDLTVQTYNRLERMEAAMDRFGKLFGRKTEPISELEPQPGSEPGSTGQGAMPDAQVSQTAPETPLPAANSADTAEQSFGLKFIFDSGEARMFSRLPIKIGRSEQNDLVINEESVSANHALVYYDERVKEICIQDLDSLNGVFVADLPTRKNVLQDGTRIALGKVHLVYRDTGYLHPA